MSKISTWVGKLSLIRHFGVFIDSNLSMRTHVNRTVLSCFNTLRQLRNIRRLVQTAVFQSLVVSPVLSQLDYCNSVLAGLPANVIHRLQSVQNAAARLIFRIRNSEHITDTLISLHWLRVWEHILFKIAVMTYLALNGSAPAYLEPQRISWHVPYISQRLELESLTYILPLTVLVYLYAHFSCGLSKAIFFCKSAFSAVQGHPKSLILVPIESGYATSY